MWHAFAGVRAVVENEPETFFVQPKFARDFTCFQEQMAQHLMILRLGLGNSRDWFLGDDEYVCGRLRVDVIEGQHQVVFINDVRWNFTGENLRKDCFSHGRDYEPLWISKLLD